MATVPKAERAQLRMLVAYIRHKQGSINIHIALAHKFLR